MGNVISFVNTKGGVGKSFLSVHLAVWLADLGYRAALIDADDQQTAFKWLSEADDHDVNVINLTESSEDRRTQELARILEELSDNFQFIVIDTKGSAGLSTHAAVLKSQLVCVPLQPSAADLWPIENALSTIRMSQAARGGEPQALLILNQTDDADVLAREVRQLAEQFDMPMAQTNIKRLRAYRDSPGQRQFVTRLTDRRGRKAAQRLDQLFQEIIDKCAHGHQEVVHG